MFEHVLVDVEAGVATITLNRPERLNAIDHGPGSMHHELAEAVRLLGEDDAARCIVVRGAGRGFSSGGYLPPGAVDAATASDFHGFLSTEDAHNEVLRESRKPIFAAVHGICYGAALMMALHLDFIVASRSARFGLIETRFGSTGAETLLYFVGPQWAKFLALSGELIGAPRAADIGLILEAVPDEQFDERVADLARRMAAMPTPATIFNRALLNGALEGLGWSHQKQLARALNAITNASDAVAADGRTFHQIRQEGGMDAFKEARDAPFEEPWLQD